MFKIGNFDVPIDDKGSYFRYNGENIPGVFYSIGDNRLASMLKLTLWDEEFGITAAKAHWKVQLSRLIDLGIILNHDLLTFDEDRQLKDAGIFRGGKLDFATEGYYCSYMLNDPNRPVQFSGVFDIDPARILNVFVESYPNGTAARIIEIN
ncbi:hypothetical protein ABGV42_01290 [Paenibacillus pabuli]|uniref:hypothetical protein n=1 Tax=Paenibacillus pabuli TaxID=1472 RepID=UPI003241D149